MYNPDLVTDNTPDLRHQATTDNPDYPTNVPPEMEAIARKHHARVVCSLDQIDGCHASLKGLSLGLFEDITAGPELLRDYCGRKAADLLDFNPEIDATDNNEKLWLIPGYSASTGHLNKLLAHIGRAAKPHPAFTKRRLTTRVMDDAKILAESIRQSRIPINLAGHSRGGLVVLCALQILQDMHLADLVKNSILLSPTSNGLRPEISTLVKHLGIDAVGDLCQNSRAIRFWQRLNPANRAKVQVVSQEGGDAFTSPERSFVPGGTMFLTPSCGHLNSIRDPDTDYFKLTVDLVKHAIISAN